MADFPIELDAANPQKFTEAIDYFRKQAPWISGSSWNEMARLSAIKGDQISSTTLLAMVDDLWGRMDAAVVDGIPYKEFVRTTGKEWAKSWWKLDSPRMALIYQNNVGSALMAGRMAQITDPDVIEDRPYLMFDAIEDMRTSEICRHRDGIILPAADPFWRSNIPLLHHNCRSSVISLDAEDAEELGGVTRRDKMKGLPEVEGGWGSSASWADWQPRRTDYHTALFDEWYNWTQGNEYAHSLQDWRNKLIDSFGYEAFYPPFNQEREHPPEIIPPPPALVAPDGLLTWKKIARHEGSLIGGVPLRMAVPGYWETVQDVITGEPTLPQGKISTGVLVQEADGRIWVVEPKDHYGGYEHTFPKGKLEASLTAQQNALKELYEEAGLAAEITGYIGDFQGQTGTTRYYLAKRTGGAPWMTQWESQAVKLIPLEDYEQYLNTDRDREVIKVLQAKANGGIVPPGLKTYAYPPQAIAPPVDVPKSPAVVEAPTLPPLPDAPAPKGMLELDPALFVYHSKKVGGSTAGLIVAHPDAPGKTFMLKQLEEKDRFKAYAEVAGGDLYALTGQSVVKVAELPASSIPSDIRERGRYITLQEMASGVEELTDIVGYKGAPNFNALTTDQQAQLIAHGIASWFAGEHDGHAGQYLVKDGNLIRVDMGQALKYTLSTGDKLSLDYAPNQAYGEAQAAHLLLLKDIKAKKIDAAVLHHPLVKRAIDQVDAIAWSDILKSLGKYGDMQPGGKSKDEIATLLKERAESAKADWAALFKEVTGKKFNWDATAKPLAKPRAKRAAAQKTATQGAPPIEAGVNLAAIQQTLETYGAVTQRADSDKLRGQAWRIEKQELGNGSQVTLTGELDSSTWASVTKAMRDQDARDSYWESYARERMFQPRDTASSPVLQLQKDTASKFLGPSLVLNTPGYRVTFGDKNALSTMQGKIRIEVFGKDPQILSEELEKAMAAIGAEKLKLLQKPTAAQEKLANYNRALWNIEGGQYKPAKTATDAEARLKALNVNIDNLVEIQNDRGYTEPRILDRHKKYKDVKFLYHQFDPKKDNTRGIAGADGGRGGILSSVARTENGIVFKGMSSSRDMETGGGSSAYTRIVGRDDTPTATSWYSYYSHTVVLSRKLLDRTDFYGYNDDLYGITSGSDWKNREGADGLVREITSPRGITKNEVLFRNAIRREDMLFFATTSQSERKVLLGRLTASGVKTIRGQPVEDMVVVMRTPTDYSNLNPSNPVHQYLLGMRDDYPEWVETYSGEWNE